MTNASGGVVSAMRSRGVYAHYAYGEVRASSGTVPTDRRFTGQREETGLGLYDYVARRYDPLLGRFIQADTIVPSPQSPQSFNRYAYVLNNPHKYRDPTGHWFETALDVLGIAWDIYDIKQNGLTLWTGAALAVDVACLVLPIATGGGAAVRAASHADDVVDAARAVDRVDDAVDLADGLRQLDQAGDAVRAANQVQDLSRAAEFGIHTVGDLKQLARGQGLEAHHIIEQRFGNTLGIGNTDDMLGVVLTHEEHVRFTQAWRQRIGYRNQLMDLTTGTVTNVDDIWRAAQEVYKDYPELLEAAYRQLYP